MCVYVCVCVCVLVAQLRPTLCDPMDCGPPGSSVHGTSQARVLEQAAISFRDLPDPGIELASLTSPALAGEFFITSAHSMGVKSSNSDCRIRVLEGL